MQTNLIASVFALVLTSALFAMVPWLIAQPVTRWHPGLQDGTERKRYRIATAMAATAITMAIPVTGGWSYAAVILLAGYLSFHWYHVAQTPAGKAALVYQRGEAGRT